MTRTMVAIRVPVESLEAIDRRANMSGLSRTEYMIRCAMGDLSDPKDADSRLEDLERRISRMEETAYGN